MSSESKIMDRVRLGSTLKREKSRNFVFTNGCFDILHAGHVKYLEKARSLGDGLIVALNSDSSVRGLKGPSRPIVKLRDRLRVIAALGCVDYVTWFGESNPIPTIKILRPKILVKGGDYKASAVLGGREVRDWGGKIVIIPFLKGRSSSSIIAKI